jgi:hypothetical protein
MIGVDAVSRTSVLAACCWKLPRKLPRINSHVHPQGGRIAYPIQSSVWTTHGDSRNKLIASSRKNARSFCNVCLDGKVPSQ